jgi:hypothetical protein
MRIDAGKGAWVPVVRPKESAVLSDPRLCEVVAPVAVVGEEETLLEVTPGLWPTGAATGFVFVTNPKAGNAACEAVSLTKGEPVAAVEAALGAQQFCEDCGTTEAVGFEPTLSKKTCPKCGTLLFELCKGEFVQCSQCGSKRVVLEPYQGCDECTPSRNRPNRWNVGFLACAFASVCAAVSSGVTPSFQSVDTRFHPVYHIVEEAGKVDLMAEELPTDYYYEKSRAKLEETFPAASVHVLDHLEALEAFLDKSMAGFSFGVEKASVGVIEGNLLGHNVGRFGLRPDEEKVKAIVSFPALKEKQHIQQFLGCTNFLRWYLPPEYGYVAKMLGEYMKGVLPFPTEGLGPGTTPGDQAVKAIKLMAKRAIELAVLDAAAAISGERPLEQIADCCGFALGGSALQTKPDLTGFNVLVTHSK